jgi:hypothetical protein
MGENAHAYFLKKFFFSNEGQKMAKTPDRYGLVLICQEWPCNPAGYTLIF